MEETVWWTLRKRKIVAADECNKVELPALEQLQALGWDYLHGSALAPGFSCSGNVRPWPIGEHIDVENHAWITSAIRSEAELSLPDSHK